MLKELHRNEIYSLLKDAKTIAVVGISGDENKTSRVVASFLLENNYRVVGVNPAAPVIPGIPVYKSLTEIPFDVDIVDVFRRAETIGEIIPDVIKIKPKCLWLQQGIRNNAEAKKAFENGINIVQDACTLAFIRQMNLTE